MGIIQEYINNGLKLVPIPPESKGPIRKEWNLEKNALLSEGDLPEGYGVGLMHAYSGTMALDIDDLEASCTYFLRNIGINLYDLINQENSVVIVSGKENRCKLLFRMPNNRVLQSKKIIENHSTIFELRCSTNNGLTVQDVLPPSIHPETKKQYTFTGKGNWSSAPYIPTKLIEFWESQLNFLEVPEVFEKLAKLDYTLEDI